jgi:hypothetical protein
MYVAGWDTVRMSGKMPKDRFDELVVRRNGHGSLLDPAADRTAAYHDRCHALLAFTLASAFGKTLQA